MRRLSMNYVYVTFLSLLLLGLASARASASPILIDLSVLGAVDSQITSGGQTFVDIGTTLGAPSLVGVDLTLSATATGFFDTDNSSFGEYEIDRGTVSFLFSAPVLVRFVGGGSVLPGETDSFGPAGQGSLTSPHTEAGLVVTDDSIANTTTSRIVTNQLGGGIIWQSSIAGTSWTHTVSGGNQGAELFVVPEPSTVLLVAWGLVGSGVVRRRSQLRGRRRAGEASRP
ncbi:MAG: PEP-CTERM sorting domain-containing protein [Proteobacteria bacterium]|nr:PEP-CTERM sorting domain-containing protein [Pseudomonadota bacterium]